MFHLPRSIVVLLFVFPAMLLFADPPATVPATQAADPDNPLVITAVATPAAPHPGDALKLEVTIKNNSPIDQTIDSPNYAWWAHSDSPAIIFPAWPKHAGHGPVVMFKPLTLTPGQTYTHTWDATVSPDAPVGDLTFRMGISLHKNTWSQRHWSADIKLKIEAKEK